jgi:hypothetical protein
MIGSFRLGFAFEVMDGNSFAARSHSVTSCLGSR